MDSISPLFLRDGVDARVFSQKIFYPNYCVLEPYARGSSIYVRQFMELICKAIGEYHSTFVDNLRIDAVALVLG